MRIACRFTVVTVVLASLAVVQPPALAETLSFTADLKGTSVAPSTDHKGNGSVSAEYDTATQMLSWAVNYTGLTSDVTGADFNGPAAARKEAASSLRINGALASPIEGAAAQPRAENSRAIQSWHGASSPRRLGNATSVFSQST